MSNIRVLGIESSCDDSAAAIVDAKQNILANIVISQDKEHEDFQGVVPEIAARSHLNNVKIAINSALSKANMAIDEIDAIAATAGPGLIGGVIVGTMYGKSIASVLKKPYLAINHLEGHALTARLTNKIDYPYLLLLTSGGHCQFIAVLSLGNYKILGRTLDDAAGEAFDKVAKMMGLGFPGGPKIEEMARSGDPCKFDFPKPIIQQKNCDMSFSGLKTAVRLQIEKLQPLSKQNICDISASFQQVVTEILLKKTKLAIVNYEKLCYKYPYSKLDIKKLVIAGGVAANINIRENFQSLASEIGYNFVAPPINLCTDNAAMIAFSGLERLKAGIISNISFKPRARWSLEDI